MARILKRLLRRTGPPPEVVGAYRRDGFAVVRGLLSADEASRYAEQVERLIDRTDIPRRDDRIFLQIVNAWQQADVFRSLTLNPRLTATAGELAGVSLRLWHDQILVKRPQDSLPTEFHQDQPYWPHSGSMHSITSWIALTDVPVERGCMSFIPGTHRWDRLPEQDLAHADSLFEICPEMEWMERVTVPLRKGDCTFHHGRCAHMAGANRSDGPRIGFAVIFIDAGTRYSGAPHLVTDPLSLSPGQVIEGPLFPLV